MRRPAIVPAGPNVGPHTISPTSALPTITGPVIINGYSQAGASANTNAFPLGSNAVLKIELDGIGAAGSGLFITAGSSTVKGLVINRFSVNGIHLTTNGGNTIEGNFIGTNVAGTAALGNSDDGVQISSADTNTIGGTTAAARNVISGNGFRGVMITGTAATGNVVQGNFIGTDAAGTGDLGNGTRGVFMDIAPSNTIGGTSAGEWNVISGNGSHGIFIFGSTATGNVVKGNFIGTDAAGTSALGNGGDGVHMEAASFNFVGGSGPGEGNVISDNGADGIEIFTPNTGDANSNEVRGNFIGTKADGTSPLGNAGNGIKINGTNGTGKTADDNIIGGTTPGEGNIIAHNNFDGVLVKANNPGAANRNSIQGNSIYANGGLGIELLGGPIANENIAKTTVTGVAAGVVSGSAACGGCTVDVYSDADGEGRIHHGAGVLTNGGPDWTFSGVSGPNITATNTDEDGNTSAFSTTFLTFTPSCTGPVATATIITAAKGQSPKNNPKVSHSIAAKIPDAADYGPTAHRIKICKDTAVTATITDLTGTPENTPLSAPGIECTTASCTVGSLDATEKYKSRSADGKDTDRVTLLPVP